MISFAVTAKLICAFVFAYAHCWFSHAAAHIILKAAAICDMLINVTMTSDTFCNANRNRSIRQIIAIPGYVQGKNAMLVYHQT